MSSIERRQREFFQIYTDIRQTPSFERKGTAANPLSHALQLHFSREVLFNCREFDRTSGDYFKGMLDGTVTNERFNEYMIRFPKKNDI